MISRVVALDPLGARFQLTSPFGIEHVDGVVGDALHQQPELFLAPAELGFGPGARSGRA